MKLKRISIAFLITSFTALGFFVFQRAQAQTALTTISGKFYRLEILAANGQGGVGFLSPGGSINDLGTVGFVSTTGLYMADGRNPLRAINGLTGFSRAQLNNQDQIISRRLDGPSGTDKIERYDTTVTPASVTQIASGATPEFSLLNNPSINNANQVAFSSVQGSTARLVTGTVGAYNIQNIPNTSFNDLFPIVSSNGRNTSVLTRIGTNATPSSQAIRLYTDQNLTGTPVTIASVGTDYTMLGSRPGMSDDGAVIAFYAQTPTGPGIFASFDVAGTRRTVKIARRQVEMSSSPGINSNFDGVCDAGETNCVDGELGFDAAGNPLFFNTFDPDARVGVVRQDLEPLGSIEGDVFIVSFIATPNGTSTAPQYFSNQRGLWTIRVDIKSEQVGTATQIREKPARPMPVVQIGDLIGAGNLISGISVDDPLALSKTDDAGANRVLRRPDHFVAFTANTQAGSRILVRGTHVDSDEDSLPDHWERTGIDFDQNGGIAGIDLPLHQAPFNANPNRKDIFVEIDYMEGGGVTYRPDYVPSNPTLQLNVPVRPMERVRNAFASAPLRNPDNSFGITLHTFVDEPLLVSTSTAFPQRLPGNDDDFDDIKFGSNGTTVGIPCGTGATDGHFGTLADRQNAANCQNILGARRLAFRYAVYGNLINRGTSTFAGGRAELPGNDFLIGQVAPGMSNLANSLTSAPEGGTFDQEFADIQAKTFMHEFGHTLGLRHGGEQLLVNCEPNYISIMNYSYGLTSAVGFTRSLPGFADATRLRVNARLDYARAPALSNLIEASLNESAGVNGTIGTRILYGLPVPAASPAGDPLIGSASGPVDWNGNSAINPAPISGDVNRNNVTPGCSNSTPNETLTSFDDWGNLTYNFYGATNFSDGELRFVDPNGPEFTPEQILNAAMGSTDVDNDEVANIADNCLFAPNTNQSDGNSNEIGDACDPLTTVLADVSVTMTESADPAQLNTPFDYIATIRNDGGSPANSVVFTNQLPANTVLVSVTPSQGSCSGTANINCNVGTILSGATATVTIRVTPTVNGKLDNYVAANSEAVLDPNILNNNSSASTAIFDPAQTFTISGTVVNANGIGVSGVTIGFDGTQQGNAVTDSSGNYSISVASGGIYDLMATKYGFAFTPPSRTVAYIAANQTVNFTATDASASVGGRVTRADGYGLSRARVTITDVGGNTVAQTLTSSFGYYNFGTIALDQTYTITVTDKLYQFIPRNLFVFEDVENFNFVAQP